MYDKRLLKENRGLFLEVIASNLVDVLSGNKSNIDEINNIASVLKSIKLPHEKGYVNSANEYDKLAKVRCFDNKVALTDILDAYSQYVYEKCFKGFHTTKNIDKFFENNLRQMSQKQIKDCKRELKLAAKYRHTCASYFDDYHKQYEDDLNPYHSDVEELLFMADKAAIEQRSRLTCFGWVAKKSQASSWVDRYYEDARSDSLTISDTNSSSYSYTM